MLVLLLAAVNAGVVLYDRYLLAVEMKMRVRHVANRLKQVIFNLSINKRNSVRNFIAPSLKIIRL